MKETLLTLAGILVFAALCYLIYFLFVPMRVIDKAVDRKVIETSQQYATTNRQALVTFYSAYNKANDPDQKQAILGQMC